MLALEEILCELERNHESDGSLPPGFRFHPTDEELITFYLASKVFDSTFSSTIHIAEVDLNRIEPWELPDEAKMGEREWYFFSLRDRKYPTGLRTNRATGAGYWKATGKDKEVYSASSGTLLGMKKTLVFYRGRAPRGEKTKWVMHEYRLEGEFSCRLACKEEWVICRIFHKIGEKRTPQMLQSQQQAYTSPKPNPSFNTLPPLLETQSHQTPQQIMQMLNQNHQDPFLLNNQETDLKSLINPLVSQYDIFSSNFSNPASLFADKSLSSHQDFTLRELSHAIAKQCKKEGIAIASANANAAASSTNYSPFDGFANMNWVEKIQENNAKYYQNQLLSGIHVPSVTAGHNGVISTSSMASTVAIDHVMSTEPAFSWW